MRQPAAIAPEPDESELRFLRALNQRVDDLLEQCLRGRENLAQCFRRLLPELIRLTGASAVAITTRNEDLEEETWAHGSFGAIAPSKALADHR